jgi:hypothetical protein
METTMKVFLSWSGRTSREIATAFHDWLPYVIQAAKPFISTGDIDKGKRWSEVLATELGEVAYGIICITQDNFREPWVNFEAGAISKAIDASYVSPFLFNVESSHIQGPLQQFQFTINEKEDIFNLLRSINSRLKPEDQLTYEILRREFDVWWPELNKRFIEISAIAEGTGTGFEWLYTADDLARIQTDAVCKCVWFITPDLYRNALVGKIKDAIRTNMERETSYTFIIPHSDEMNPKDVLKQMAESKPGQIHINDSIQADEFRSLAVTDYLIMNADSGEPQAFLELPITSHGYWIKVDDKAAMGFVIRFRKYAHEVTEPSILPT